MISMLTLACSSRQTARTALSHETLQQLDNWVLWTLNGCHTQIRISTSSLPRVPLGALNHYLHKKMTPDESNDRTNTTEEELAGQLTYIYIKKVMWPVTYGVPQAACQDWIYSYSVISLFLRLDLRSWYTALCCCFIHTLKNVSEILMCQCCSYYYSSQRLLLDIIVNGALVNF